MMQLFVAQRPDMREEELEDIKQFKKTTISCYLRCLDGRSCWTTLIRSAPERPVRTRLESAVRSFSPLSPSVPSEFCWRTTRTGCWWSSTEGSFS